MVLIVHGFPNDISALRVSKVPVLEYIFFKSINLTFPDADYFRMEIENVGNSFRQMLYSKTRPDSWGRKRKDRG